MKKILICVSILASCWQASGQNKCSSLWQDSAPSESFSQSIRSNPEKFFAFLNRFVTDRPRLETFLQYQGWISGDSHPGQWSFVPNKNKFVYTLIDFDMAGRGPLFLDFMQYALNIKAIIYQSPKLDGYNIRITPMLEAYLSGLRGESFKTPKWIRQVLEVSERDFKKAEQKYYNNKIDKRGHLVVEEGFAPILEARLVGELSSPLLNAPYFKNYVLRDIIEKHIERGGSAGQKRYWVLLQSKVDSSSRSIFEMKQKQNGFLPESERASQSMYEVFWGETHPAYFEVKVGPDIFEVRPKKIALNDAEVPYQLKGEKDWEFLEEKALYDLYRMGLAQAKGPEARALADLIANDFPTAVKLTKEFSEKYIKENDN